jgi:K+-transporting ATPase ATPase C chain
MLLFLTLFLGLGYPVLMTGFSKVLFPGQANGSLQYRPDGQVMGSVLIGQKFEQLKYFWGRPSAVDFNPMPSGGSNLGPTSKALKQAYEERLAKVQAAHPGQTEAPPPDLLFASASGVDPHISPLAARYQINRVAQARGMDVKIIESLIQKATEGRQFGFLGEERVNVLMLNQALDQSQAVNQE